MKKTAHMKQAVTTKRVMPIAELLPSKYNPRKITRAELDKLRRSIETFGYVEPVVWNERSRHVVGGHQRLKVLHEMGFKTIEVTVVDLDEKKEQLLNVALNRISGSWDEPMLANLLATLQSHEADVSLTGFDADEMNNLQLFIGDDFKRMEFKELVDKFTAEGGACMKNENWFYVEFYQKDKIYQELLKLLRPHMTNRGNHEIDPVLFYDMVKKHLGRKAR